jgi:hypothetical protein
MLLVWMAFWVISYPSYYISLKLMHIAVIQYNNSLYLFLVYHIIQEPPLSSLRILYFQGNVSELLLILVLLLYP